LSVDDRLRATGWGSGSTYDRYCAYIIQDVYAQCWGSQAGGTDP
jgi:hypothetical protein